jgi:predicted metal-dependent peptidase
LGRRGNRKPELWNMANDYIVNYTLKKEGVGTMPDVGLISDQYTDEMTSEEVYKLLEQNQVKIQATLDEHLELGEAGDEEGESDGGGGGVQDGDEEGESNGSGKGGSKKKVTATVSGKDGPPKLSKEELQKIKNEMKAAVIQAAHTMGAGKVPAGIRRLIAELTEPKLDWRTLLEMHIQSAMKDDFTWLRPSKRSWVCKAVLPGQNVMNTIDVMIFIDASGSISEQMLKDFLGEVKGIMDTFPDFTVHLATFDTKVYNYKKFRPDNLDEIHEYQIGGGGGTDFECMYHWMRANDIEPMKMVCFTDGYPCGSWGDENYCPDVLWIIHYDASVKPPFGTGVLYDTER